MNKISFIPKDWKTYRVVDLFAVETGTTPSTKQKDYWENGAINWVTPSDMSRLDNRIKIGNSERKISEKALKDCNLTLMPVGSIIISTRAPVGYVAVLQENSTFNQGCKGLILRPGNEADTVFYYYYLLSRRQELQNLSGGSTFKELSKDRLESFKILFPPLSEQKRIAEVLSTVDQAIEKVGKAIEKTKRLQKGLMQELLTKDIGHKEFKDTEIRMIPKNWGVRKIEEISLDFVSGGTPSTSNKKYWNGDIPWMTSAFITEREIKAGQRYITKEGLKNSATNIVPKDNLVVATIVGIGKAAINRIDLAISQDLTGVIIDKKQAYPDFLYWALTNSETKLKSLAQGSTIKGILREGLGKIKLPLPPLPEQQKIAEILASVDKRLELLREKKESLQRTKKGLMNDLLTGKRRVRLDSV
jgi:type I restriction enzyme S subunit